MATVCKTCGGPVNRVGNYYVCEYCRNKWEIDSGNDVHAVDRANAWSALRDGDFEKAVELFENIIVKEAKNHEAYWGRALALAGIVYVTDMNENKKVPTCNNITENSFMNDKDVQKAISLAPSDIADGYKQQAEYIEKVRVEWLEKASKEPAYDVFISFKDSDCENGIERTQDSIDAQDLYNALVAEGYKVFFSRISLRDKIAEQYEPYIYNAIKTAKVMIVFGEKAEYFSSVWIKNEWSRFKSRIEKGEKHKNSLVVVYKNMNPGELPVVLKSRQCLNASDMTFLSDLTRHIKRVVEESKRNVHLEKIEIAGGQIAKKASTLTVNSVQTREVGAGAIAETSISEKQSISLIQTYLGEHQWQEAATLVDDVLFNNPSCAEAIWCKLLSTYQAATNDALVKKLDSFNSNDYGSIEKALNCASKEFAEGILLLLYDSEKNVSGTTYKKILTTILPFSFNKRQSKINSAFNSVIETSKYEPFELLLSTLKSSDVDKYISYNYKYAMATSNLTEKIQCLNHVLKVDEGNIEARQEILKIDLLTDKSSQQVVTHLESLLKYTNDVKGEVVACLDWLCANLSTHNHCAFARELLRYYTDEIITIKNNLKTLGYKMIAHGFFDDAEYFLNLILSFDQNFPEAYWGICLIKIQAKTEKDIRNCNKLIKDIPEYTRYLALVDEKRRKECISIAKEQCDYLEYSAQKEKNAKKAKKVMLILASLASIVIIFIIAYNSYIEPNQRYEQAVALMNNGAYSDAEDMFEELGSFKDSSTKLQDIHNIETYNHGVDFAEEGDFENALKYFREIPNYKDSANYIKYCEAIINANEIFDAETKLKSLPSNFLKTKEILTFIENNKIYRGKKYQYPKEVASWNSPSITLQFKLLVEDGEYKVNCYHVHNKYSYSQLKLSDVVNGKHSTSGNGSTSYVVINENTLEVYNYFHDGTRIYKAVN